MLRPSRALVRSAGALLLCASPGLAAVPASAAPVAARDDAARADFDGDGYADQVISAPEATVDGREDAGYLVVVYGSGDGVDTGRRQLLSRAAPGVPGRPAAHQQWGRRAVARDLDGDGVTDLAVSGRGRWSVTVLWGARDGGLTEAVTLPEVDSGAARLVAGDFDGDGHADLAGGGGEQHGYGDLRVLHGPFDRATGLAARTTELETGKQDPPTELVAGDLTGDGVDDLVSMHAFEERSERSLFWRGGRDGPARVPAPLEDASAGAVGDVDGDGYGDLVLRPVPGGVVENLPYDPGTVRVLYGSPGGPGAGGRTATLTQESPGVPGTDEEGDQFGAALAAGDVTGDGFADVAVGVPYEDLAGADTRDTGAVVLLQGSADGLRGRGARAFHQATPGVTGIAEAADGFGSAVSLRDLDADGHADLALGTPGEDSVSRTDTGAAWVFRGTAGGVTTGGLVSFGPGQLGAPETGARLGSAFAR